MKTTTHKYIRIHVIRTNTSKYFFKEEKVEVLYSPRCGNGLFDEK